MTNILIVSGNCGGDAELRYTQAGQSVASFSVPATSGWGDNKKTSWVRCTLWGKRAEAMAPYLVKGQPVVVNGEFSIEEWTTKEGEKRTTVKMNVQDVTLMGSGKGGDKSPSAKPAAAAAPPKQNAPANDFADFDDNIPF